MADQEKTPKPPHDEDTQAILTRRRFLIASTLAGVGAAAVAAVPPGVCLSIARPSQPPATGPSTQPATNPTTQPQPCLEPPPPPTTPPEREPGVCLSVVAPPEPPTPPEPQPCLKLP